MNYRTLTVNTTRDLHKCLSFSGNEPSIPNTQICSKFITIPHFYESSRVTCEWK